MQYKLTFFTIVFAGMLTQSYAQKNKQPQVQQTSIWMEGFEADGKLDEWQQPLQAYTDDGHISYSLANDDINLYLVVTSNRISKIFRGGVTFVAKRGDSVDLKITYPYNYTYDMIKYPNAAFMDPDRPKKLEDFVSIETSGLTENEAPLIGLVNQYGIQVGIGDKMEDSKVLADGEEYMIVEFAIPLSHLGGSIPSELEYGIHLRGIKAPSVPDLDRMPDSPNARSKKELNYIKMLARDAFIPLELKGTYRLATKPD
ncbi:hypothetical protein [Sphingobacterium paucimobilis]|uniref:Uncharacterized protein n=1 Tax=Sphingobacterium paucimobilis HER1398 TaxID=1346330 RepID=U2JBW9_9SPHI|nr:hypothetical protein [Sphingobacterium paucimobilis]ERJ60143.1 hypothetical protein M472_15375 [Sphingobacterium paucimobilis HER1398]